MGIGAGVLTALPALSFVYMAQPDNFSLYQPLVAGALFLAARGLRGRPRSFALAGLLAGVATLSRNDGVLVLAVLGATFLWDRLRTRMALGGSTRPGRPACRSRPPWAPSPCSPWPSRPGTCASWRSSAPSRRPRHPARCCSSGTSASGTASPPPPRWTTSWGWASGRCSLTRVGGLVAALFIFSILVGALVLVPPLAGRGVARRRDAAFGPFFAYAALLFAFSALVSAVHVPGGTFIHSAVALAPHGYVLALWGIVVAVGWIARRREGWDAESAGRVFVGGAVAFGVIAAVAGSFTVHGGWDVKRTRMQAVASALDAAGAPLEDRVMSIDASGYRYWSGHPGVVLVNDPLATVEEVARAYDIRWLVLERADVGAGCRRRSSWTAGAPDWVGPPILETPDVSVYPVCTAAGDPRCAAALVRP